MSKGDEYLSSTVQACRLWTRPWANGGTFLSGRWGGARVLAIVNLDRVDPGDATHLLILKPAAPQERKPRKEQT